MTEGVEDGPDRPEPSPMELSARIVAAYVRRNIVSAGELPKLVSEVHGALKGLSEPPPEPKKDPPEPAVPIDKSVRPDCIVCLEDGKAYKSLRRHLRAQHGLSPEQYREKWNLPQDYPLIAPEYSGSRSHLAKQLGLGRTRPPKKS
jgi:predicted transcriptional regulator